MISKEREDIEYETHPIMPMQARHVAANSMIPRKLPQRYELVMELWRGFIAYLVHK